MKNKTFTLLLALICIISITGLSCTKDGDSNTPDPSKTNLPDTSKVSLPDTSKVTLNVLETLSNGKEWTLVSPASHNFTSYGLSSNVTYPYLAFVMDAASFTVTKTDSGSYRLYELKNATKNDIDTFIPFKLSSSKVTYEDLYYLTYNETTRIFSCTFTTGGTNNILGRYPFFYNYILVSLTKTKLVIQYAVPDPSGSNSWSGQLVFESK